MSKESIASAVGMDIAELGEYRYYSEGVYRPVYSIGDNYYCAGKKHPEDLLDLTWKEAPDQWCAKKKNTIVWVANCND